jgi:hypothetical protein
VHGTVVERVNSRRKLLGVGEMGVYSYYIYSDLELVGDGERAEAAYCRAQLLSQRKLLDQF